MHVPAEHYGTPREGVHHYDGMRVGARAAVWCTACGHTQRGSMPYVAPPLALCPYSWCVCGAMPSSVGMRLDAAGHRDDGPSCATSSARHDTTRRDRRWHMLA